LRTLHSTIAFCQLCAVVRTLISESSSIGYAQSCMFRGMDVYPFFPRDSLYSLALGLTFQTLRRGDTRVAGDGFRLGNGKADL
jgi:hypothetical protein